MEKKIREILSVVFKRPLSADEEPAYGNTPEWDSLRHMELIFSLEEEFDIFFSKEEIPTLKSFDIIVQKVKEKHEA